MKNKNILRLTVLFSIALFSTSCLESGLDKLENSSDKELTSVDYTYRFAYDDTIKKGTPNQEILEGRICEVLFKKNMEKINEGGLSGFKTTLTHDINSVLKAGPTGSVTKDMLYDNFKKLIAQDQLGRLWVYVTISDGATVSPSKGGPKLGSPGDFSVDRFYEVKAADGSKQEYIIKTVKGF